MSIRHADKIIVALDFNQQAEANQLIEKLAGTNCKLKIGKEMFTYFGPEWVKKVVNQGFDVFLDLKFHDIPNTVAKACEAAAKLGVWMINVHASGGTEMMTKAAEAVARFGKDKPLLTGVTVLTSMDQAQYTELGFQRSIDEQVLHLATLAKNSGLDGIVCSAQESKTLKQALGSDFKLVTPGIRPVGSEQGDQSRVMTPNDALEAGSDFLVVGRPITKSADPLKALCDISESIAVR